MATVTLKVNQFWGRRSGSTDPNIPKGCNLPWGNVFKQQQWGAGASRSSRPVKCSLLYVNKKWFK